MRVLVPWVDLMNHDTAAVIGAKGVRVTLDDASKQVRLDSFGEGYAAGEEVFISYGQHGNADLLAQYGLVIGSISHHPQVYFA